MRHLCAVLAIAVCTVSVDAAIPQAQRDALLALYSSTNGDGWTSHTNWGGAAGTECSWEGVQCNAQATAVTAITLPNHRLTGPFPSLTALTGLTSIDLSLNSLSGALPGELGQLTALTSINVLVNNLTGPLPPELSNLRSLQRLMLGSNKFSGTIPPSYGDLSALTTFDAGRNSLTGSLNDLARLSNLQFLNLISNQFSGPIPPGLASLTKLTVLFLSNNQFSGPIPSQLTALSEMGQFDVSLNQLTGPFPDISNWPKIRMLQMSQNKLSGSLPANLGQFTQLTNLSIDNNQFSGPLPSSMSALTNMLIFNCYKNSFTGALPDVSGWTRLQQFTATYNQFTGTLPSFSPQAPLASLSLGNNRFTGTIPSAYTQYAGLVLLVLESNRLTGQIPPDIGNLRNLTGLYLGGNQLTGSIPPSIGSMTALTGLGLGNNLLSGTIPSEITNLSKLDYLVITDNELSGSLPPALSTLPLTRFYLNYNKFSGTIPAEWGSFPKLKNLWLGSNQLRGPVPSSLINLKTLDDNNSDFTSNLLFTTDAALKTFLDRKQLGGKWAEYQTLAPTNARVTGMTDRSAAIAWTPVPGLTLPGGYQVSAATSPGGAPVAVATTPHNQYTSITLFGLSPSTQYHFTVMTVTFPAGFQKSLLTSDPTPSFTGTTTAAVSAPALISLTTLPKGLVQIDGVPANQDIMAVTNYGDATANVTLVPGVGADFLTLSPTAFSVAGGQTATITISSIAKPAGTYFAAVTANAAGANSVTAVVSLLSTARPAGTPIAEAVTSRIEFSGTSGSTSTGTASFRNTGTALLSGILVSDGEWIRPSNSTILISVGQTVQTTFSLERSRKPTDVGSVESNLNLLYVAGRTSFDKTTLDTSSSGISVSTVKVVDTTKASTSPGTPPGLAGGEIAFFAPGLTASTVNGTALTSDLVLTNTSSTKLLSDLKVYFTPSSSGSSSTAASFNSIATAQSVNLVNILPNIYGAQSGIGTLQVRSTNLQEVSGFAKLIGTRGGASFAGDVPLLRSDRSAKNGETVVLTGLTAGADIYIQETAGAQSGVTIEYIDAAGTTVGTPQAQTVAGLSSATLSAAVPATAITAIVTNRGGGQIGAYARVLDPSGDTYTVVDWGNVQNYAGGALRVPFAEGSTSTGGGRRRAVPHATTSSNRTDIVMFNPGEDEVPARVEVLDATGRVISTDVVNVAGRQTLTLGNVAAVAGVGQVLITPARGEIVATSRNYRATSNGTFGTMVPVVSSAAGLRIGQSRIFAGVEDLTTSTIAAAAPGTYRSALGLSETTGQTVTVRVKVGISETSSLAAPIIAKNYTLAPNQQIMLDQVLRSIAGASRDSAFPDLHAMKLQIDVIDGKGAVFPFLIMTDNGSGDTYLRLE
jgi:Leucine-rich repeat (LRR) protein